MKKRKDIMKLTGANFRKIRADNPILRDKDDQAQKRRVRFHTRWNKTPIMKLRKIKEIK